MRKLTLRVTDAARTLYCTAYVTLATLTMTVMHPALAITGTDLTQDTSGGKKLSDVAENLKQASQETATLLITFFALVGLITVGMSLMAIHKASKDERDKPVAAFVGLGVGGLMTAVSAIMFIARNTAIGTT